VREKESGMRERSRAKERGKRKLREQKEKEKKRRKERKLRKRNNGDILTERWTDRKEIGKEKEKQLDKQQ
jgi:hypothetical protein